MNRRCPRQALFAIILVAVLVACDSADIVCAETGEARALRLVVLDRRTRIDLTTRTAVTVTDLRSGFALSGAGNDPLRLIQPSGGRWSIGVSLEGYRSTVDTVTIARLNGCAYTVQTRVHSIEIDPQS